MKERIEHRGVVEYTDGEHVRVRITGSSACTACEARTICHSSESKEKIVDCTSGGKQLHVGDVVTVYGSMQMGRDAVVIAFVVPLVLVVAWMFGSIGYMHIDELTAIGGVAVVLAVYYSIVYCLRHRLSRRFEFQVET